MDAACDAACLTTSANSTHAASMHVFQQLTCSLLLSLSSSYLICPSIPIKHHARQYDATPASTGLASMTAATHPHGHGPNPAALPHGRSRARVFATLRLFLAGLSAAFLVAASVCLLAGYPVALVKPAGRPGGSRRAHGPAQWFGGLSGSASGKEGDEVDVAGLRVAVLEAGPYHGGEWACEVECRC